MLGTKFNMFCSPHPNGILINEAKFIVLGPKMSPVTNKIKTIHVKQRGRTSRTRKI